MSTNFDIQLIIGLVEDGTQTRAAVTFEMSVSLKRSSLGAVVGTK